MSLYQKTKAAHRRLVRPVGQWDEIDDLMYRTNWAFWNLLELESQIDTIVSCIYWFEVHKFANPFDEPRPAERTEEMAAT